ncbi:PI-PLC X domain-containing protein 1, partial [Orchesella cincta]
CFDTLTIFLTVSPMAKNKANGDLVDRLIEINWNNADPEPGDWIALFDHRPEEGLDDPLETINVTFMDIPTQFLPCHFLGYLKTDYRLDRLPIMTDESRCLGYWIAYIREEAILMKNCISTFPRWMHELRHDNHPVLHAHYDSFQDESVYRQLAHGIRYLDVRVGYYPASPDKFWINHNFYRIHPLADLLRDVKRFVDETHEIVILDFHRFPVGFATGDRHSKLAEFLNSEIGEYATPSSLWPNATPNEIWATGKPIILSYSDPETAQQYRFLWPPLPQEWGDKRTLPELKGFLRTALQRRGGGNQLWAAMAEFTPKPLDIVLRPTQGLRNMAQTVNIPMTFWYQDKSWYTRSNIIATDFFLGNNIIQTSIIANYKGYNCSR